MIDNKNIVFLSLLVFFFILSGCVIEKDSVDRVDYGNGFYFQWYTFVGNAGTNQKVSEITHDSEGNIYILGTSDAPLDSRYGDPLIHWSEYNQSILIKMNPDGIILWHMFLPGGAYKMVLDKSDQIYLLGGTRKEFVLQGMNPVSSYNSELDIVLIKLNSDGDIVWYSFFGGSGNDSTRHILVHETGIVYFNGLSHAKWNNKYGNPVDEPVFSYYGSTLYMGKVDSYGNLISHTFSTYKGSYLSVGRFCFMGNKIYMQATNSITKYSTPLSWKLTDDLETIQIGSTFQSNNLYSNFSDGNIFGYEYGDRSENSVFDFFKYDTDLNPIWNFTLRNYNDEYQSFAGFGIADLVIDKSDNIYFLARNAGKLLSEYYYYPIISPLLKYLNERMDNTIYSRKFLMKISSKGSPEWYSYLGHSGEFSCSGDGITVSNNGEIYITENNSHFLWPDIYGSPKDIFSGTPEPYDGTVKYSILIAKLQSNPSYPKIRIYETVYKKLILLKKKTYIKLDYSISLPFGVSDEGFNFNFYKFDNEGKRWKELKRHDDAGDYSYKDKHVYQEEFNHYKVTAYNRNGEKIAESRIISVYPPRPNLNIEPEGE